MTESGIYVFKAFLILFLSTFLIEIITNKLKKNTKQRVKNFFFVNILIYGLIGIIIFKLISVEIAIWIFIIVFFYLFAAFFRNFLFLIIKSFTKMWQNKTLKIIFISLIFVLSMIIYLVLLKIII